MPINWLVLAPAGEDYQVPTYGLYGGPDYSSGILLGPNEAPTFTATPVDRLDALFRKHDIAIRKAPNLLAEAKADVALIKGIMALPASAVTGEGDLYAGAAIIGMIGRIIVHDHHPEVLAKINLPKAIDKAVSLIKQGSIQPDAQEVAGLAAWLDRTSDELASGHGRLGAFAAGKLLDLAAELKSLPPGDLNYSIGDQAFTFPVKEAKTLLVEAVEATWSEPGHHTNVADLLADYAAQVAHHTPVATPQIEALVNKLGFDFHF
jgi:hypothetical protein